MDFTLALTHFCEAHGPKSVLCTQVLPLECDLCLPPSPPSGASSSIESLNTEINDSSLESSQEFRIPPTLRKTDTNLTLPTDFSGASTTVDSDTESPIIEKHPLFQVVDQKQALASQWRYGRNQGETCASCSFSVPKAVAEQLPAGAPGSRRTDGTSTTNTGAPVLRSREFVCLRERKRRNSSIHVPFDSKPSSYGSSVASSAVSQTSSPPRSHHSDDCHDHTLTYLTAKSPVDPEGYGHLRASVIRTLSCELLPRGSSDGPFCFGDTNTGYTIAYVFRLTDPKARGRRRAYAFIALAGKDASRAFQACPMLWESFKRMAKGIETAAQRHQDLQRQKEETGSADANKADTRNYTPVSSFLTSRNMDPDGHPRRAGQATPRSLAEIVGDENIFTFLHQYFVAILRCLGEQFGGTPLAEQSSVYQSTSEEAPHFKRAEAVHRAERRRKRAPNSRPEAEHIESLRDDDATPKPQHDQISSSKTSPSHAVLPQDSLASQTEEDDIHLAKSKARKTLGEKDKNSAFMGTTLSFRKSNPQCAVPLAVNETVQRHVVV
ncbi:hypothetical protein H2200_004742 [Cladophialophora chaetospira]|uniref:UDENN FLCN/SMCR8-type domain-containing protein n=1 Tax=Cladophialophora chaetospira TaxID=386627 RepID=A0AA38XDN9_9EURO|nr:hypothetical protein H2200_004742 [Cladophialophora chaetospira]